MKIWPTLKSNVIHPVRRRLLHCLLWIVLALVLACSLLALTVRWAAAQTLDATDGHEILLLIDNSNSMYEKDGLGSDPDLLRIEAARLFLTYLGVDSGGSIYRLGVIFFGGEAQLVAPPTSLSHDSRRAELARLIADPPRQSWTNPQAALDLAEATFTGLASRRAVVLLTDGKPELSSNPTSQETAETISRLQATAARLAAAEIPFFIILLQNQATDADPEIEQVYVPLWQEMAAGAPPGRFYRARRNAELMDIYHDIVVALTQRQTAGVILHTQVQTHTVETAAVEPDLLQVTFVIHKSVPELAAEIYRPSGQIVSPTDSDVRYGGQPGLSLEEIWAISNPAPGLWQVHLAGQGQVTVWKDFYPAPATSTFTPSPTPSATYAPTSTPTPPPTYTATPSPTSTATRTSTPLPLTATNLTAPTPHSPTLPHLPTSHPLPPPAFSPHQPAGSPGGFDRLLVSRGSTAGYPPSERRAAKGDRSTRRRLDSAGPI